jgi:uncharacterized protein YbjT (DUF2867 family)
MRVLVTGASGFIGHALADALAREGHEVIRASRRGDLRVDFASVPSAQWWKDRLAGIDAVVNAVGILRESGPQSFAALHARAPSELFRACAQARVRYVVQVSALGADEAAQSSYHLTKKAADDVLRSLEVPAAIVQPSLVYGPGGASSALFDTLAASPLLMLPQRGEMQVQPVHIDDVVDGVVRLLHEWRPGVQTIPFVGPEAMSLREYLRRLRSALGIGGRALVLGLPVGVFRAVARAAGRIPGSFLDAETAQMLLRGNTGEATVLASVLGHVPREVQSFVPAAQVDAARTRALLGVGLPVLRISLAALWIWTAVVSFGLYPVQGSLELLARVGLHGAPAMLALYGAAALDLVLGVLTLVLPSGRRSWLWVVQMLLIGGYTALITLFLPEFWLHPYGPVTKNLPVATAIALLWALEPRRDA